MSNPRKPAAIRKAEGNRGHRAIPDEIVGVGRPEQPSSLTEAQRRRWDEIVQALPEGLLTRADTSVIERMSVAWCLFREVTQALNDRVLVRGRTDTS